MGLGSTSGIAFLPTASCGSWRRRTKAFKIKSKVSGKCVDVVGMSQEDGARLQIWEDLNGDNQQWKLVEVVAKKAEKAVEQKEEAPAKEIVPEAPKAVVKAETKTSTKAK